MEIQPVSVPMQPPIARPAPIEVAAPADTAAQSDQVTPKQASADPIPAETPPAITPEELAIRAAFQAQLETQKLMSMINDPEDLVLPDAPDL
ncbi:MAG: hypothetical protein AB8B71_02410 [Paracoccaceae bacterium]